MGFFRKEKAIDVKPLTDYFEEREGGELFNYAVKILSPQIFMGEIYIYESAQAADSCFKVDKYETIPKVYKKGKIYASTLLELACEKGSGAAAFLLGILHEHGIGCSKSMKTAELWYSRAIDLVSYEGGEKAAVFVLAVAKARSSGFDFSTMTDEPGVGLAIALTSLRMKTGVLYEIVSEQLKNNQEWLDELVQLGYFILCNYAIKREVTSMCELAVCMFQSNIAENGAVKRLFYSVGEEKIIKTGEKLLNRCIGLARSGDDKARYYLVNILGMKL
ncbi:MAG: sel1 repeat family protein [Clostridia bacterium]|nr:sel1 repeat family protein [Clostridia bacterium]